MAELAIDIDGGHLFRYPSEVDPRKKATKGGYLSGTIQLPSHRGGMRVVLSTHPDTALQYAQPILDTDPAISTFHPAILHLVRKEGKYRQFDKEPVPNIDMYQQEIQIINKKVILINKRSRFDLEDERNIPLEDEMFNMGDDNCLHLGSNDKNLNLIVLKPKTDMRSTVDDVTLNKMIEHRISDENLKGRVSEYFSGKNAVNKTRIRIKVDVFDLETGEKISEGLSGSITDTNSKECGAMTIHDVSALKSCSNGGRKIFMVSEFGLAKDVEPVFQLWSQDGIRIDVNIEKELIMQPQKEQISIVRDTIIFITPSQPNIQVIRDNNLTIKLLARRKKDEVESQAFDFHYELHNAAKYVKVYSDYSFEFQCIFCDHSPDSALEDSKGLVKVLEVARPGSKRKTLPVKRSNPKQGRVSTDTDTISDSLSPVSYQYQYSSGNEQSPDSGIQSSPYQLTFSNTDENIEFCLLNPDLETPDIDKTELTSQEVNPTASLEMAGFTSDYIEELSSIHTMGSGDYEAAGTGDLTELRVLDQGDLDEFLPEMVAQSGYTPARMEVIEKDGRKNKTHAINVKKEDIETSEKGKTVDRFDLVKQLYKFKYVPIIFILILMCLWKPVISTQELIIAVVSAVTLNLVGNWLSA